MKKFLLISLLIIFTIIVITTSFIIYTFSRDRIPPFGKDDPYLWKIEENPQNVQVYKDLLIVTDKGKIRFINTEDGTLKKELNSEDFKTNENFKSPSEFYINQGIINGNYLYFIGFSYLSKPLKQVLVKYSLVDLKVKWISDTITCSEDFMGDSGGVVVSNKKGIVGATICNFFLAVKDTDGTTVTSEEFNTDDKIGNLVFLQNDNFVFMDKVNNYIYRVYNPDLDVIANLGLPYYPYLMDVVSGQLLMTTNDSNDLISYDFVNGKEKWKVNIGSKLYTVVFSDEREVVIVVNNSLKTISLDSGKILNTSTVFITPEDEAYTSLYDNENKRIYIGSKGCLKEYSLQDQKITKCIYTVQQTWEQTESTFLGHEKPLVFAIAKSEDKIFLNVNQYIYAIKHN